MFRLLDFCVQSGLVFMAGDCMAAGRVAFVRIAFGKTPERAGCDGDSLS